MKQIPHDPRFDHVDLYHTDLHTTFARVRAKMKAEAEAKKAESAVDAAKVQPLRRREK